VTENEDLLRAFFDGVLDENRGLGMGTEPGRMAWRGPMLTESAVTACWSGTYEGIDAVVDAVMKSRCMRNL
jgi:hypothetical protein